MTAWVLVLVFSLSNGGTALSVDMPSWDTCRAAMEDVTKATAYGPGQGTLALALCVKRS